MSSPKPLQDRCDGCGRPDGIHIPHRGEHLCPRCSELHDRYNLAHLNLEELVAPVMDAWRAHWVKRGLSEREMSEILELVGKRDIPSWTWEG